MNNSRQIPLTCSGHSRPVVQIQMSPFVENNQYYLISACKDGFPMLREGRTGDWIGTFLGHKGAVWSAKLDITTNLAATASADFTTKIWDAVTGECRQTLPHSHIVRSADFNQQGTHVITGGYEKILRIFDINYNESPIVQYQPLSATIKSLIWDKYRNIIFSSGEDNLIRVWDPRSNTQISQIQASANVTNMELSLDHSILSFTSGKKVEFWDPLRLTPIKEFTVDFDVSCVSMNPVYKSKFVVGAVNDLWVRSFDFTTGEVQQLYKGHHGPVHSISHSPDGEIYATGSEDGTIRLWQTNPDTPYGLWQYSKVRESNSPNLTAEGQTELIHS